MVCARFLKTNILNFYVCSIFSVEAWCLDVAVFKMGRKAKRDGALQPVSAKDEAKAKTNTASVISELVQTHDQRERQIQTAEIIEVLRANPDKVNTFHLLSKMECKDKTGSDSFDEKFSGSCVKLIPIDHLNSKWIMSLPDVRIDAMTMRAIKARDRQVARTLFMRVHV